MVQHRRALVGWALLALAVYFLSTAVSITAESPPDVPLPSRTPRDPAPAATDPRARPVATAARAGAVPTALVNPDGVTTQDTAAPSDNEEADGADDALWSAARFDTTATIGPATTDEAAAVVSLRQLRQCRPLGPAFARAFVRWLRAPATAASGRPRRLIYSCESHKKGHFCGGMGDRFRGMITAAFLALVTNRKFELFHPVPVPLQRYLRPRLVNWIPTVDGTPATASEGTARRVRAGVEAVPVNLQLMKIKSHRAFIEWLARQEAAGTADVRLQSNSFSVDPFLRHHAPFRQAATAGLGLRGDCNITCYFGCLHAALFAPAAPVRAEVDVALRGSDSAAAGGGDGGGGDGPVEWDHPAGPRARRPFVGVQVRMGGPWAAGLRVPEPVRTPPAAIPHFRAAVDELRRSGRALADAPIFISSDSERLLNETIAHYGAASVRVVRGDAFQHVDTTRLGTVNAKKFGGTDPARAAEAWGYLLTLANHVALTLAAHTVMAQSGYGDTAFWVARRRAFCIFVDMSRLNVAWHHRLSYPDSLIADDATGEAPAPGECYGDGGDAALRCGRPATVSGSAVVDLRRPPLPFAPTTNTDGAASSAGS